jgi:hypothetical protein
MRSYGVGGCGSEETDVTGGDVGPAAPTGEGVEACCCCCFSAEIPFRRRCPVSSPVRRRKPPMAEVPTPPPLLSTPPGPAPALRNVRSSSSSDVALMSESFFRKKKGTRGSLWCDDDDDAFAAGSWSADAAPPLRSLTSESRFRLHERCRACWAVEGLVEGGDSLARALIGLAPNEGR